MKRRFVIAVAALAAIGSCASGQLTLDYCLERAEENYPLISRYELVSRTGELSLSDINKGWLPRISVYAQAGVAARAHRHGHRLKLHLMVAEPVKAIFYISAEERRMVAAAEILAVTQYHTLGAQRYRTHICRSLDIKNYCHGVKFFMQSYGFSPRIS